MRKTFTLLLALVATVSMMAEPFFVRVNGTTDYAATATGEKDYQDRDQYAAKGIALAEGDLLTCFDQGSNAEWNIAAIDPYGAYENFSKEATALKCNVAGTYNIYIKLKMNDDLWYIELADNPDPGTDPGNNCEGNPRYYWKGSIDGVDVEPDIETMFYDGIASISFNDAAYVFVLYQVDNYDGVQYMTSEYVDDSHTSATLFVDGKGIYQKWKVPAGTTTLYLYDNGDGSLEISNHVIEGKQLAIPCPGETAVENVEVIDSNAPAFNILGMPVTDDYKGIVIQGGRKFIRL